ncbi:hypothetical protein WH96_12780 [Kiloniella spongiae]|uniref:Uncharacterized protein n=1 Tax=Kiloniella spongiae TaxID=1489064 RepID=A0A0H2MDF8_9PROT|nr:hypothetical protein [Kiloniella spongiae]KLN60564.1 hypothetical protein WH96_12780 [Kiloniella spongiae]
MHEDDLREFVQAGIREDEEPLWFAQPQFSRIWQREYTSPITKFFLFVGLLTILLNIVALIFFSLSTILNIFLIVALGGVILRFCWIYYLGRRLVYVLTSKRLVFFLESAKPIEYKSFSLDKLGEPRLVRGNDDYDDVIFPALKDGLFGVLDSALVKDLIASNQ